MASNGGLQWCGGLANVGWLGPLMSPCSFESVSSAILLAIALVSLLAQAHRLAVIQHLRAQGRLRKAVSGLNGSFIAASLFICGTHLLHFTVGVVALRSFPYHVTYHAFLAIVWALISVLAIYTGRLLVSVDFRAVTLPATLVYAISLYSFYRLYFDPHAMPLPYIKAAIWTAMLQTVVASLASWLGFRRAAQCPPAPAMQAALGLPGAYQQLPAGAEEGAGGAAAGAASKPSGSGGGAAGGESGPDGEDGDGRSWISLFSDACAYVWPESRGLQLRTLGCLVLLVAMRVINLAVPILYKRVVD
ncbi:hypothetical protein Agub_g694, partial [Astrephomene gubernaculifera]